MSKTNEEIFKEVLEQSLAGYWDWDIPTGNEYLSPSFKQMFGYEDHEMENHADSWQKIIFQDDLPGVFEKFNQHIESKGEIPFYNEVRYHHKNGSTVWVICTGKVIEWDKNGKAKRMVGSHIDITDRMQAEVKFKSQNALLLMITETSPVGIVTVDKTGNITYANKRAEEILGLVKDQITSVTYDAPLWNHIDLDGSPFPDEKQPFNIVKTTMSTTYDIQHGIIWPDGTVVLLSINASPMKDIHDNFDGMLATIEDITDRKKAENKLQESEEKYRAAFMTSPDSVNINRMDGLYVDINEGFTGITGYTREDVIGKLSSEINIWSIPEDREKLVNGLKNNGKVENLESVFRCKDGFLKTALMSARVVTINNEPHILSVTRDITDIRKAERATAAEKERLAVTLRSIGDGVITTDMTGNVVIMNKVAEELTGWKQEEAQGKNLTSVFTIIHEITRNPCENPVERVLSTGNVIELANHTVLISRDGIERIIADSGAPIKDKDGQTFGVVLVFRDMTEKQRFLEITQNSQKLESLGILAGGIAHDFNNLLGGIYGYIDMAYESSKEKSVSQYLQKTMNTIERARALTQQLLTFAKGGAPVQKVENVFPFVQETVQFALSGSNINCNLDIPNDLWACNYDKNQIGQVIDNLVINAIQAMPMGGAIEVTARNITLEEKEHPVLSKGDYVRISIKDSGIGIPREMLSRIFDPFFTTKSKGHGLGLATCYSIMNRHGGCIDVNSDPGKGSVFHVYLPATEAVAASIIKKTSGQHKGSGTFLVMDDEEVMREILADMLKTFGYDVVCKDNGKDAIEYFTTELKAKRPLSGIIFDLTVPGGMGGMEAVAEVRKIDSKAPVFVASGYADGPVMKNPTGYGFTASICKPFRRAELMEMLEKHMHGKKTK